MAFQFLAALAGVSAGAADSIKARNEELQRSAEEEITVAMKAAEQQRTTMQTRRSALKETADLLSTYSQGKLTKTQIAGLLQTPAAAKEVANKLKSARSLDDVDFESIYKLTKPATPEQDEGAITSTIDRMTRAPKPTEMEAQPSPRGAFGLPTRAYSETIAAGERAAGMSLGEMKATARGIPELSEEERIKGTLDLSQFSNPEAIGNIQAKLRDARANKEDLNSPKNKKLSDQLVANAVIENQFKDKEDGSGKPRTTAQITSIVTNSLRVGLQGYELGDKVRWDPESGSPIYTGDVAGANKYAEDKRKVVENQYKELGYIKEGKIVNDRNARDAILPYASIDENGNVNWRKPKIGTDEERKASAPPAAASARQVVPYAIPLPSNPADLVAGQTYHNKDKTKNQIYNGVKFQPVQ